MTFSIEWFIAPPRDTWGAVSPLGYITGCQQHVLTDQLPKHSVFPNRKARCANISRGGGGGGGGGRGGGGGTEGEKEVYEVIHKCSLWYIGLRFNVIY